MTIMLNSASKIRKNTDASVLIRVLNCLNFDLPEMTLFPSTSGTLNTKHVYMAELTAKLFRDFFGGSWYAKVTRNSELEREVVFNWPELSGNNLSLGTGPGIIAPPGTGILDDTRQVAISGWRHDIRRWSHLWHNEFGGYGELQWTSQVVENDVTVLYGFGHECKQECDDMTDHITKCEIYDHDNFKYTIQSFRKGLLEIVARRIRTGKELNLLLEKQSNAAISFEELLRL
jgi:hypothetical protein